MNNEIYNENKALIERIVKRIETSVRFVKQGNTYYFDDSLSIDNYNNIYCIEFKGIVLGHYHSNDTLLPEYSKFYDAIYNVIKSKKDSLKTAAISSL